MAGVVHVHTTLSDGGGTPEEVIEAAKATGLAFLGITDHNNLDAKPFEGYRDGVLVLVGAELSTPPGHVLGLGLDRDPAWRFNGDGLDGLEDVRDLGGVPFAAHPFSARPDLRWNGWDLPGPWGIELLNGDSDARRAGPRVLLSVGLYRLNPALRPPAGPAPARRGAAPMGRDAGEARRRRPRGVGRPQPPGDHEDPGPAVPVLRVALRAGPQPPAAGPPPDRRRRGRPRRGARRLSPGSLLPRAWTPSRRPTASASRSRAAPGSAGRWATTCPGPRALRAVVGGRVPKGTRVVLLRDGKAVGEGPESLEVALPGPGVYRVEARVPGWPVPWVITNPVYVHDEETREARRRAAAWPGPPPPPRESRPLASLDGSAAFNPEFDPSSWMDTGGRRARGGAGRHRGPEARLPARRAQRVAAVHVVRAREPAGA